MVRRTSFKFLFSVGGKTIEFKALQFFLAILELVFCSAATQMNEFVSNEYQRK